MLESLQRTGIDFGGLTMTLLAPSTAVVSKTPEVIVAVSCWFQFQHSVIEREAVPHKLRILSPLTKTNSLLNSLVGSIVVTTYIIQEKRNSSKSF